MQRTDQDTTGQKLVFQLGLPFILYTLLIATVIGGLVLISYTADSRAINVAPQAITKTTRDAIISFFDQLTSLLTIAAQSYDPLDYTTIDRMVSVNTTIISLTIWSEDGKILYQANDPTLQNEFASLAQGNKSYLKAALDKRSTITSPPYTSEFNTPVVSMFTPVFNTASGTAVILEATVDVSTLWELVSNTGKDGYASIYVADSNGIPILSNIQLDQAAREKLIPILNARKDTGETVRYDNADGLEVAGATLVVPTLNWSVTTEIEISKLVVNTRQTLFSLIFFSGAFILLVLYSVYVFRKYLLSPLSAFKSYSEKMVKGEYDARIVVNSKNELSLLATVMNAMAQSIQHQTSAIVEKLQTTIQSLDQNSKILVRRDIELSTANDKLKSLDKAKSEFVSIAAHQLRTPLSAIKWAQQMLIDGELGPLTSEQATIVRQSQESVTRMANLVNDLLSADHLEYDKVQYVLVETDLVDVVTHIVRELIPMAEERSIALNFAPESKTAFIIGDASRLKEAFLNVINNAIKYTPMRGVVTVSLAVANNVVLLQVKDSGIGIPRTDRDRLFEKFVRMDNAKKVDANGSGLGLFIVKKIIDAHHGKIWFESEEGSGTEFFIEFPLIVPKNI